MSEETVAEAVAAEERLGEELLAYTGRWVAVRDHKLVDADDTLAGLLARVGPTVEVFRVMANLPSAFGPGHPDDREWTLALPVPDVVVQVLEAGKVVDSKPLPPDEYIVLCGENKYVAGVQDYPGKGTTVITIKREEPVDV